MRVKQSNLTAFAQRFRAKTLPVDYDALWQWSTDSPSEFWRAVAQFADLIAEGDFEPGIIPGRSMLDTEWFPGARLNYAENLLRSRPFPSQPPGFWGDTSGKKYYEAYFSRFDNVWCQGDYVEFTERNTMVFCGRSDAVLNPGGVRIGTAEIYRQVETIPEVLESIAIGQA